MFDVYEGEHAECDTNQREEMNNNERREARGRRADVGVDRDIVLCSSVDTAQVITEVTHAESNALMQPVKYV